MKTRDQMINEFTTSKYEGWYEAFERAVKWSLEKGYKKAKLFINEFIDNEHNAEWFKEQVYNLGFTDVVLEYYRFGDVYVLGVGLGGKGWKD